jgi:hypothetical protein
MKPNLQEVMQEVHRYLDGHLGDHGLEELFEQSPKHVVIATMLALCRVVRDEIERCSPISRRSKNGSKCNGYSTWQPPAQREVKSC